MALFSDSKWYEQNQFVGLDTCTLKQIKDFKSEIRKGDYISNRHRQIFNKEYKKYC